MVKGTIYDAVERFRRRMSGEGVIGPYGVQSAQNLIRAAQAAALFPVVRVKEFDLSVMGEALDAGAGGVQVPQVTGPESAEGAVRRAKFAPEGSRGM